MRCGNDKVTPNALVHTTNRFANKSLTCKTFDVFFTHFDDFADLIAGVVLAIRSQRCNRTRSDCKKKEDNTVRMVGHC